ncbi:MAG: espin [Rickettsiales bacterium]|nr:espin [Rickettsiales bacterium]
MKEFVQALLENDEKKMESILRNSPEETLIEIRKVALRKLISNGHLGVIKLLVSKLKPKQDDYGLGLDVVWSDVTLRERKSYINCAAEHGQREVLEFLLKPIPKSVKRDLLKDPLYLAAENGHVEVVRYIHNQQNGKLLEQTEEAFVLAVKNGHLPVVQFLFQTVQTPEEKKTFLIAGLSDGYPVPYMLRNHHYHILEYLIQNTEIPKPFISRVFNSLPFPEERLKLLQADNYKVFHHAVIHGWSDVVNLAINIFYFSGVRLPAQKIHDYVYLALENKQQKMVLSLLNALPTQEEKLKLLQADNYRFFDHIVRYDWSDMMNLAINIFDSSGVRLPAQKIHDYVYFALENKQQKMVLSLLNALPTQEEKLKLLQADNYKFFDHFDHIVRYDWSDMMNLVINSFRSSGVRLPAQKIYDYLYGALENKQQKMVLSLLNAFLDALPTQEEKLKLLQENDFSLLHRIIEIVIRHQSNRGFSVALTPISLTAVFRKLLEPISSLEAMSQFFASFPSQQTKIEALQAVHYAILRYAVEKGYLDVFQFLLEQFPTPAEKLAALQTVYVTSFDAIKDGHFEIVHFFLGMLPTAQDKVSALANGINLYDNPGFHGWDDDAILFLITEALAINEQLPVNNQLDISRFLRQFPAERLSRIFGTVDTLEIIENMSASKDEILGDIERRIKFYPDTQFAKSYVGKKAEEVEKAAEKRVAIAQVFRGFTDQKDFPPDLAARFAIFLD